MGKQCAYSIRDDLYDVIGIALSKENAIKGCTEFIESNDNGRLRYGKQTVIDSTCFTIAKDEFEDMTSCEIQEMLLEDYGWELEVADSENAEEILVVELTFKYEVNNIRDTYDRQFLIMGYPLI